MEKVINNSSILNKWLSNKTIYAILFFVPFLLYLNTLNNGFVLDDIAVAQQNTYVLKGWRSIPTIFTTFYWQGYTNVNVGLYRPVSIAFFSIEYHLTGNPAKTLHFFNILYFSLSCVLLFSFFKMAFKQINQFVLFAAVLLFACHPIHTEVVANIKSRDEIFCLFFFLVSFILLRHPKFNNSKWFLFLGLISFLLALFSKETTIIFVPLIIIYDYTQNSSIVESIKKNSPILLLTLIWFIIRYFVIHNNGPILPNTYIDNSLYACESFFSQKSTAFSLFARYYLKAFIPYQLSYDYSFSHFPIIKGFSIIALSGFLLFISSFFVIYKYMRKNRLIVFSFCFLLFPLLIVSNVLFLIGSTFADRFLYIPTVGSCLLIAYFVFQIIQNYFKNEKYYSIVFVIVICLISFKFMEITFFRNPDWEDNKRLFIKDVATVPNSSRAQYNYGVTMLDLSQNNDDMYFKMAKKAFNTSISIDKNDYKSLINLGVIYFKEKNYNLAIKYYKEALVYNKIDASIYPNIGEAYFKLNNNDSSILYFEKALKLRQENAIIYNYLGTSYFNTKKYKMAILNFEKGIAKDSLNWNLYLNYGNALAMDNQDEKCIKALKKSISINSNNKQAYYFLALIYNKLNDKENESKYFDLYSKM